MGEIGLYLGTRDDDVSNINNVLELWVNHLSKTGHKITLLGGKNVPAFSQESVTIKGVAETRSITPFGKIWDTYSHVSQYCLNHEPDAVIQLWKYQTHAPGVALAGKRHGVPTVARFTGDVFREYRGYDFPYSAGVYILDNILGWIPLQTATKIVVLGPHLKEAVLARGVDERDVHLIPPAGPNRDQFYPNGEVKSICYDSDITTQRPIALYVGRLTDQKGMPFLQDVIETTLHETNYQFVLVGEGPYRDVFKDRFPADRVSLPGFVPHDQIAEYYRASTVYVHPSRFEGVPLVILEALQCDLPVIAREAGDVDFVVRDVVKTSQQMAERLIEREWNERWQNKKYFLPQYQRTAITRLMTDCNSRL